MRRLIVVGAVTALLVGAGAVIGVAVAAQAQAATPALDPAQVRGSIAYLRRTYGVSEREALRRLALQQTAQDLAARLAQRAPQTYAGAWLDQAGGGRLVVATKSAAATTPLLRGLQRPAWIGPRTRPSGPTRGMHHCPPPWPALSAP